jgi:methyl-accepting chemotaxis protein
VANESAALTESVTATSEEQRASMEEIGLIVEYLQDLSVNLQKTVDKFQI